MRPLAAAALTLLLALPVRALTPESDALILKGLDRLYALDLNAAEKDFRDVMVKEPEEPAGPFFLAGLYWVQFTQSFDVLEGGGELEDQFMFYTDEAAKRAQARLKKNPDDAEAYFFLGGVWGYRGRWKVLQRHWLKAARLGIKGYKYLQKAVKLDPGLADAYLGLGIYDYYAETLPTVIRILKNLIIPGDKARGLRYILETTQNGHYSKTEAKLFLIGIYQTEEKQFEKALDLIHEIRKEQPDNDYFGLMEVTDLMHMKKFAEAAAEGDKLIADLQNHPNVLLRNTLFYLYVGEAYQGQDLHEKAADYFTKGIYSAHEAKSGMVTYCLLRRGQSYDRLGRRLDAVQDYRDVMHRKDYFDSTVMAHKGLEKPVTQDDIVKQLSD